MLARVDRALTEGLAGLAVRVGANVQPGQIVAVEGEIGMEPLVRAIAAEAYRAGARFVDATYFDPHVKRARLLHADPETVGFIPPWYGERMLAYGEHGCARIALAPRVSPGVLEGIDPERAGRDQLPDLAERLVLINERTVNWTMLPYPTEPWARVVHPELEPAAALERLTQELVHVCRLDEPDPSAAWRERGDALEGAATRRTERRFDAVHFEGHGTDLTIGLLPTSHWMTARMHTRDGIVHVANLPTEETATTPDPERADGVVRATKPLELGGTVIEGLAVRFERGRAVSIDADVGAEALRARAATDEGAARLGEVALVDRRGRIGPLGTVFYNTLLDENAASHIALGNAYAYAVEDADLARINRSAIHIDFMIGGDDVAVTGITAEGERVPVLRGGDFVL